MYHDYRATTLQAAMHGVPGGAEYGTNGVTRNESWFMSFWSLFPPGQEQPRFVLNMPRKAKGFPCWPWIMSRGVDFCTRRWCNYCGWSGNKSSVNSRILRNGWFYSSFMTMWIIINREMEPLLLWPRWWDVEGCRWNLTLSAASTALRERNSVVPLSTVLVASPSECLSVTELPWITLKGR